MSRKTHSVMVGLGIAGLWGIAAVAPSLAGTPTLARQGYDTNRMAAVPRKPAPASRLVRPKQVAQSGETLPPLEQPPSGSSIRQLPPRRSPQRTQPAPPARPPIDVRPAEPGRSPVEPERSLPEPEASPTELDPSPAEPDPSPADPSPLEIETPSLDEPIDDFGLDPDPTPPKQEEPAIDEPRVDERQTVPPAEEIPPPRVTGKIYRLEPPDQLTEVSTSELKPGVIYLHDSPTLGRQVWSFMQSDGDFWHAFGPGTTQLIDHFDIRLTADELDAALEELDPQLAADVSSGEARVLLRLDAGNQWRLVRTTAVPSIFDLETGKRWELQWDRYRPVIHMCGDQWTWRNGRYLAPQWPIPASAR